MNCVADPVESALFCRIRDYARVHSNNFPACTLALFPTSQRGRLIHRGSDFLAVVWFDFSPTLPPPPFSRHQVYSLFHSSFVSPVELTYGRGNGMGWGRSQIIRWRESLVIIYKSFILSAPSSFPVRFFPACLIPRNMCPVLLVSKNLFVAHITKDASPLDNFLYLFSNLAYFLVNCRNDVHYFQHLLVPMLEF